ncbi:uncharacterized protein CANTADRAFT_53337 [Suhomyces tanzawaensis NRRL Y-17324]|uniref:Zn(2)-C6 fungal-type domain-containing protein n=1 Tax=Suhomyces tanzawaensis NRRL Y-17324 TaxID=984487 RepID=A0A1E4SGR1_9ASCO|nr:uncharacterized protein CANTADRAFT_53337 [Suhomyces tanzawaensis NRRL Y-17324]ODV78655.1 hypothetical protein CANTADRAFT_53337 [Suhomyces tanzawaensis NRRL Y-17324]
MPGNGGYLARQWPQAPLQPINHTHKPSVGGSNSLYGGTASQEGQEDERESVSQAAGATASGRARMRVSKACDRCRTQKIKCSGTSPCVTCVKLKKECSYSSTYGMEKGRSPDGDGDQQGYKRRRTREAPIFGLPVVNRGLDKQYVDHLENRVQYLESLLAANSNSTFKTPDTHREPPLTLLSASSKWRFSRRHQNLLTAELCNQMYLNLSEESQSLVTMPRMQYFGWNMSGCNYLSPEDLPNMPEYTLDIDCDALIDYYLDEVNPLFSILHETVFREQVEAYDKLLKEQLTLNKNVNDRESKTNQTRLFSAILYLVYAISIRFMEMGKPRGPSLAMLKLEEQFFRYGYRVVSIISFEWESFELIQCWCLIALYLRVTHRQTSAYHAMGQAILTSHSMGIGQNISKLKEATPYEVLKAKRVFWTVYTMDRLFGMQTGRYEGYSGQDTVRPFPSMVFKKEAIGDDWLTPAAFATIHLARIANFIHTTKHDEPGPVKYQQINKELAIMEEWFNENGYNNDDIFAEPEIPEEHDPADKKRPRYARVKKISPLIKTQVKLHFYDIVLSVHGKLVFNYLGKKIESEGLLIDMVVDACDGIVKLLTKCQKAGKLFVPWYQQLLLLFNVGIYAITLINGGICIMQARTILKGCIQLCSALKKASVRDESSRKVIIKERFKMAKECLWALKMANRMLSLRLQEDVKILGNIGIDHGSSDVNIQMFSQLGLNHERTNKRKQPQDDEFSALLKKQLHRSDGNMPLGDGMDPQQYSNQEHTPSSTTSLDQNGYPDQSGMLGTPEGGEGQGMNEVDYMLGNLQWFDQWMDFNYEFDDTGNLVQ